MQVKDNAFVWKLKLSKRCTSGKENNFKKISEEYADPLDAAYDTSSIMHYGKYAFNKNGRPTIEVIGHPFYPIGQRYGFSNGHRAVECSLRLL